MENSKRNTIKRTQTKIDSLDLGKLPPQAIDIEDTIIGSIIQYPNRIEKYKPILTKEMFYKEANRIIYEAALDLYHDDKPIDLLLIVDKLKSIQKLDEVGGPYHISELVNKALPYDHSNEYSLIIFQNFIKRELIRIGSELVRNSYDPSSDMFILLDMLKDQIDTLETFASFTDTHSAKAVKDTLKMIDDRVKGYVIPFIKTGHERLDSAFAFEERTINVIAAQKGHMKSKFIQDLTDGIFENNKDVSLYHVNMEEPISKVTRGRISRLTGISDRRLMSKEGTLSNDDRTAIYKAAEIIDRRDIIIKDTKMSIGKIKSSFKIFCNKRPNRINVLIVDNLGLIPNETRMNSVEFDDYVAGQFVDLRDITNGLIFIIHHFNKSQMSKFNIIDGYRPRDEHMRGSSRIADYANNVMFLNSIGKWKDLIREEIDKKDLMPTFEVNFNIEDQFERIADIFLQINDTPDKNNQNYSYDHLKKAIITMVKYLFSLKNLREWFPDLTIEKASEEIIMRYVKYVASEREVQNSRDTKYRKTITDPLTFLTNKSFLRNVIENKESRSWYLYGGYPNIIKPHLKELFIIDGVKIRDGSFDDDSVLIRFIADGSINRFKEIDYGE